MVHLKQEGTFRQLDIEFLKIAKAQNLDSLPHCLTTFKNLNTKQSIIQRHFTALQQTHQ